MNNKIALESLAMDLKRIALGYHRNSLGMANRFYEEALKRRSEIDVTLVKPYIQRLLGDLDKLNHVEINQGAEQALLMSILLQNYVTKNFSNFQ